MSKVLPLVGLSLKFNDHIPLLVLDEGKRNETIAQALGPISGVINMIDGLIFCGHWISRASKTCCPDPRGIQEWEYPTLVILAFDPQPVSQTIAQTRKDLFSAAKTCKGVCGTCSGLALARSTLSITTSLAFAFRRSHQRSICKVYLIRVLSIVPVTYWDLFFNEVRRRASLGRWFWLGATWCTCLSSQNTLHGTLHIEILISAFA